VTSTENVNLWRNGEHALAYLQNRDSIPHRVEGYEAMLEVVPKRVERVLDLGTGDGNVLALVLAARPESVSTSRTRCSTARGRGSQVSMK